MTAPNNYQAPKQPMVPARYDGHIANRGKQMSTIVVLLIAVAALLYFTFRSPPKGGQQADNSGPDIGHQILEERVREMQDESSRGPLGAIDPNESIEQSHARSHMD